MNYKTGLTLAIVLSMTAFVFALGCGPSSASRMDTSGPEATATPMKAAVAVAGSDEIFDGKKVVKTDAEWKKLLTKEQFYILREDGTDHPYKSQYHDSKEQGDYHCAACNLKVFSSDTKFDSETGWPSYYQPVNAKNVMEKVDRSLGEVRTEVECARCGSHLGHVFDDGPKPTGLRYCINGTALRFEKSK